MTDRRAFDKSGERKEDVPAVAPSPPASAERKEDVPAVAPSPPASAEPPTTELPPSLPPADFATLILSLGSSAIVYLGETGDDKKPDRNLPMAKHVIDLLTVLEDKTKGNLTAEEGHILESLLFDLRLRYVEALKASPAGG